MLKVVHNNMCSKPLLYSVGKKTIKIGVDSTKCRFTEDRCFQCVIISRNGKV